MKNLFCIFGCITILLLGSCSRENLYEFEELSRKDDFIIELLVQAEKAELPLNFRVIVYKTDGYGRLLQDSKMYGGAVEYEVVNSAVKKYKKVGITVIPEQNVGRFQVRIYNLETGYHVSLQQFEEVTGRTTIFYDFETAEETVLQE